MLQGETTTPRVSHSSSADYISGPMKAVSIKQPWASLIAAGIKTLEIRQWPTEHRGPLLIVSSRRPVLEGHRHGQALCVVDLVQCRRMTREDLPFACIRQFYPDHYAWVLRDVKLIEPFGVMGQLRLFDVADRLIVPANLLQTLGAPRIQ